MIRHLAGVWIAAGVCSISSLGFAADRGVALGLRTGYALPFGNGGTASSSLFGDSDSSDLSDDVKGMLPIWVDLGYRINPALYLGGFFQYGIGFINNDKNSGCTRDVSCSANDVAFGATVHYHFSPAAAFNPWIGAGLGYEFLSANFKGQSRINGDTADASITLKGELFLLEAGGDFMAMPDFAVGPFVSLGISEYRRYSAELVTTSGAQGSTTDESGDVKDGTHEWLTIGVRGQYNL